MNAVLIEDMSKAYLEHSMVMFPNFKITFDDFNPKRESTLEDAVQSALK